MLTFPPRGQSDLHSDLRGRRSRTRSRITALAGTCLLRKHDTRSGYKKDIADKLRVDAKATTDMQVLENTPTRLKVKKVSAAALASGVVTDWTLLTGGNPICYSMVTVGYTDPHDPPADRAVAQNCFW